MRRRHIIKRDIKKKEERTLGINIGDNSMAIDYLPQFDSFKKGFLFRKPPDHSDRREPAKAIEPTRTQTAPET
jgi:hypothetical protein